jgi:hypothetical protein
MIYYVLLIEIFFLGLLTFLISDVIFFMFYLMNMKINVSINLNLQDNEISLKFWV